MSHTPSLRAILNVHCVFTEDNEKEGLILEIFTCQILSTQQVILKRALEESSILTWYITLPQNDRLKSKYKLQLNEW